MFGNSVVVEDDYLFVQYSQDFVQFIEYLHNYLLVKEQLLDRRVKRCKPFSTMSALPTWWLLIATTSR